MQHLIDCAITPHKLLVPLCLHACICTSLHMHACCSVCFSNSCFNEEVSWCCHWLRHSHWRDLISSVQIEIKQPPPFSSKTRPITTLKNQQSRPSRHHPSLFSSLCPWPPSMRCGSPARCLASSSPSCVGTPPCAARLAPAGNDSR